MAAAALDSVVSHFCGHELVQYVKLPKASRARQERNQYFLGDLQQFLVYSGNFSGI